MNAAHDSLPKISNKNSTFQKLRIGAQVYRLLLKFVAASSLLFPLLMFRKSKLYNPEIPFSRLGEAPDEEMQ